MIKHTTNAENITFGVVGDYGVCAIQDFWSAVAGRAAFHVDGGLGKTLGKSKICNDYAIFVCSGP